MINNTLHYMIDVKRTEMLNIVLESGSFDYGEYQMLITDYILLRVIEPFNDKVLGEYALITYENYVRACSYIEHIDNEVDLDEEIPLPEFNRKGIMSLDEYIDSTKGDIRKYVDTMIQKLGRRKFIEKYEQLQPYCEVIKGRKALYYISDDIRDKIMYYIICSNYIKEFDGVKK